MACSSRMNEKFRDLGTVRALAQKAANALSIDMIIYQTICDGIKVYKFSQDWPGAKIEVVRFVENASGNILPSDGDFRSITTKTAGSRPTKSVG